MNSSISLIKFKNFVYIMLIFFNINSKLFITCNNLLKEKYFI